MPVPLTYPHVGATRTGSLPAGWRHVRHRVRLPDGSFAVAGEAVLSWRLHRAAGVRITADAPRAAPGVAVTSGLGVGPLRLDAPCEVVWVADDDRRAGFGYGTLPGHPASGEEAFVVERDDAGRVWFEIRAFSRPQRWIMRAAGPAARLFQHGYARWLAATLRRLCARAA
ncbi:DUF1990 domain-containing protein [Micromonospora sp. NPDC023956]|uniref:DUF1990 family protein n=1 Tax=Micromonospora sp. NPDC023956 TaxID=3155722 RepID=UPI0033C6980E